MTKEYPHWAVVAARTPWIGGLALLVVILFGYDAIHYIAVSGFSLESLSMRGWRLVFDAVGILALFICIVIVVVKLRTEYPHWAVPHWAVVAARTPWIGGLALLAVVVFGYDAIHYIAVSGFSLESLSMRGWRLVFDAVGILALFICIVIAVVKLRLNEQG
jgi:hypothetical protein